MFQLETVNELYCKCSCFDGSGKVYTKAGSMVAYNGKAEFTKTILGPGGNPLQSVMGQIGRRLTGENMPLMVVESKGGQCEVMLANLSQHVTVIPLQPGVELKVESEYLLAFTESCKYSSKLSPIGVIAQRGLFTSSLKSQGQESQVAILSEGNPLLLSTPCCADPDAVVAWTGPDPTVGFHMGWRQLVGQASGETYVYEFKQPGYQVIVQPSERKSGLDIGIDGRGGQPDVQQNQGLGDMAGHAGDVMGQVGNMLGGLFGGR